MQFIETNKHKSRVTVDFILFNEGGMYVAYCPSLQLSTYGTTANDAKSGFNEALEIFFEDTLKKGTSERLLLSYGWTLSDKRPS
jgi:hypothetical protein